MGAMGKRSRRGVITQCFNCTPATATLTFSSTGPTNNETFTLGNVTFTAKTSGATGNQFNISSTPAVVATNLAAAINASPNMAGLVTAGISSTTITETPVLLTAANFSVLAGAAVTNTGASVLVGDVGAVSAITGMSSATVTGTVHDGQNLDDAATAQALVDATAAYNTLSVLPAITLTGDLGGMTLTPGVYSYPSSAGLTGTLTLDFMGLSNQMIVVITESTLTTASNAVVNVVNSNATNQVFFVVGSSATLGSATQFAGNILAHTSISFVTGANVANGNAIALTGSVTLQDDNIQIAPIVTGATGVVTLTAVVPGVFGNGLQVAVGTLANTTLAAFTGGLDGTTTVMNLL